MDRSEIYQKMSVLLVETLGVDEDEIEPSARFFHDLSGESIDLLDLSFHCQKTFGTDPRFQNLTTANFLETDDSNRLTPASLAGLQEAYPFIEIEAMRADPSIEQLKKQLTVDVLVSIVEQSLPAQQVG